MGSFRRCAGVLLVAIASANLPAQEEPTNDNQAPSLVTTLPSIPAVIHEALQSQEYESAVRAIDGALEQPDTPEPAYLLYLKGRALTELNQFDAALDTFAEIEQRHLETRWVSRARFGRADVYVRNRQYSAAGEIYRAEAERLLSRDRKDELAGIYTEFADRYFKGVPADDPSQEKKPDYQQALTYYQEALKLGPSLGLQQRMAFRVARCHQELENTGESLKAYQQFLTAYAGEQTDDDQRASEHLIAEARFQLGAVHLKAGQSAEARKTWQDFLAEEAKPQADDDDLRAQAAYRLAHTYGVPQPSSVGNLELGVAAAVTFLDQYPDHELAPQAELEIAQAYAHHGRFAPVVERMTSLIANPKYARAKQVPVARQLLGQSYAAQRKFDEAITAWKEFLEEHPTDPHWSQVQRTIVDTEFAEAEDQRREKNYEQARLLWETFLNKYPLDGRAAQILLNFGQMQYAAAADVHAERVKQALDRGESPQSVTLSDNSRASFEAAIADWRRLLSKYPETNEASQAAFMIGVTLEDRLERLKEALEAYRQVTGNLNSRAQQRITRLTEPQLDVITERKFRSDETPRIKITTRNLESVSVKMHRIDMTDYFRKMHLASGVETLDIALIDPDKQWEHAVADYEQYQRIAGDIEIPMDGPGVTAVTVSSDKLEATTMVLVSDLDVIVKSSRNELFLFAQNMRTGQPVEGASVLISDGSEIFAEEVTGQDGILQRSYEQLKGVSNLRVFTVAEGHAASTVNNLNGLDFAVGLAPKGYVYTDRPAYRAGQLVNIKAIVRWVDQDRLTFKPGERFRLDVYDARSRVVHSGEVALNDFGTIADRFILPDSAAQGAYRVHLHQPAGKQSYETNFTVMEYQLEPVQLAVDLPRQVYYRGETIEGKFTLKYYYGTPLAGREIQYRLGDGRLFTATTDSEGEAAFTFETQRYSESQPLQLTVQYPERSLSAGETVYLATRGFEVGVTTLRDVYLNGETFEATFTVSDPAGEPVAAALDVEVFEEARVNGKRGERLVATHEVATDKDKGQARQTLRLDAGGRYLVRATGTDRFGNTVSGQHRVHISGDKDSVRLRILADQHHYHVGDEAQVRLHWREGPALALVTYEGASILGYQLVQLSEGANALAIPMESSLAPNFNLSVAVMQRNRFHAAASPFRVSQRLQVTLKPDRTELKPGEDLNVAIEVTDPQGRPVAAELSLALVQTNLLNLFDETQQVIDTFFGAGERTPSIRQATSCTFRYRPQTRGISRFLLAEEERKSTLQRELRALATSNRATLSESLGLAPSAGTELFIDGDLPIAPFGRVDPVNGENRPLEEAEVMSRQHLGTQRGADSLHMRKTLESLDEDGDGHRDANSRFLVENLGQGQSQFGGAALGGGSRFLSNGRALPQGLQSHTIRILSSDALGRRRGGHGVGRGDRLQTHVSPVDDLVIHDFLSRPDLNSNGIIVLSDGSIRLHGNSGELNADAVRELYGLLTKNETTLNALTADGELLAVNGRNEEDLRELVDDGLRLLPGMGGAETAFWDPVIVTDDGGRASVTITLPQRSTAWKLRSKGINGESLAGQAEVELLTKKDLFGELKLPLAFTAGDKANVLVEVHNSLEGARSIAVQLRTALGEKSTEITRTLDVQGSGISELSFPIEIAASDARRADDGVSFELYVTSDENTDRVQRTVAVHPDGLPVYATASGTAGQSTIAFVQFEEGLAAEDPALEILIGPNVNRALLDAVLGGGFSARTALPVCGIERAVSDVLGGVALLEMIGGSQENGSPDSQALAGRIAASVAQLIASQRDDGAWSWSGRPDQGEPDRFLTSRVVWALSAAREAGFAVQNESFGKALQSLKTAFTNSNRADRIGQVVLLHGLAAAGAAEFAHANRLYRDRNSLGPAGLVHLALVFAELDRRETAGELLRMVKIPIDPRTANRRLEQTLRHSEPWLNSGIELRAMYLLALQEIDPANAAAAPLVDWLLASRAGSRWPIEKANGPAVVALAQWSAKTRHDNERYTLTISVNGRVAETLTVDPAIDASRRIAVPDEFLDFGQRQRINFDIEGRARFSYSAVMTGFVHTGKLPKPDMRKVNFTVRRWYEPAQRMLDGQPIPRGFSVVAGSYQSFRNTLTQLPVGQQCEVTLSPRRVYRSDDQRYEYLVITEPIPAGCTVLGESVRGQFERYELSPGAITFYVGSRRYPGDIQYSLVGYLPGEFRTVPSVIRDYYEPQHFAVGRQKDMTILARGEESGDEYRLTPDELYHFGQRLVAKGDDAAAHEHLRQLFKDWQLDPDPFKNTVQWLFTTSLAANSSREIVGYFEIIKEKFPDVEVSFESILKVAAAYRELGEHERSYLVYRATVEGSFERESQVAGFLEDREEFLQSVQVFEGLLHDYPAEAYVAAATYALAQEVYRKAPQASDDAKLKEAGLTRVELISSSTHMLDHFLSTWPSDPAADQASFALANTLMDLDRYKPAITRCEQYAERYPDSRLLDSYWYIIGYSHFALGQHEEALARCQQVADAKFAVPETGGERDADNKWEAVYIMGQVYHSLSRAADAITEYTRVEDRFADASEAIEFFSRKDIALDEVTTLGPTEDKHVTLRFRNVPEAALKVYRIDLMKFGLMQRNLDRITAINLAGIRPYHEETIQLGDGQDYRDRKQQLTLPLDEEGAYLVVCRGENLYTSGLVMVSPLSLEIQEDAASGRVRVTVKDQANDRYADEVHVKVIGSANEEFSSGETDLRGLFVADDVQGTSTVIALADENRYAFYRGEIPLQGIEPNSSAAPQSSPADDAADKSAPQPAGQDVLRQNLYESNSIIQQQNRDHYENLLQNDRSGIKSKEAY